MLNNIIFHILDGLQTLLMDLLIFFLVREDFYTATVSKWYKKKKSYFEFQK